MCIFNPSVARGYHTAWTPTSLPGSIVLLGGDSSATELTAEVVPGIFQSSKVKLILHQGERPLISHTLEEMHAVYLMENPLFSLEATVTGTVPVTIM